MIMLAIQLYVALVLGSFLFLGYVMARPLLAALWYRLTSDPDVYPPEAAEAPDSVDEHFKTALTDDIDWHRYEYELKRKQT